MLDFFAQNKHIETEATHKRNFNSKIDSVSHSRSLSLSLFLSSLCSLSLTFTLIHFSLTHPLSLPLYLSRLLLFFFPLIYIRLFYS